MSNFKKYYQTLYFDVDKEVRKVFTAKQGDTDSRGFYIKLIQKNELIAVTNETMTLFFKKPDQTGGFINAIKDGDEFRIDLTNQVFAVDGYVLCELLLRGVGGEKITDKTFQMFVESSMQEGSLISTNERGLLDRAFELAEDLIPRMELINVALLETYQASIIALQNDFELYKQDYDGIRPDLIQAKDNALTATTAANAKILDVENRFVAVKNTVDSQATAVQNVIATEAVRVSAEEARALARIAEAQAGLAGANAESTREVFYAGFNTRLDGLQTTIDKGRIYSHGARRTLNATSPLLTRLNDAVGKVANVPTNDSVVVNDFDNIYPWSHIRECKRDSLGRIHYKGDPTYNLLVDCDWLVEIPKFYIKFDRTATTFDRNISEFKRAGYWLPSVFIRANGSECDKIYVGRFKTGIVDGKDVSRPGIFPDNFRDLASFRTGARAKGAGWQLIDLSYKTEVLESLYIIESATLQSQDYLGNGITSVRYVATDKAILAETAANRIVILTTQAVNYNVGEDVNIGTAQGSHNIARNRTITAKNIVDGTTTAIVFDGAPVNIVVDHILWQGAQRNGQTVNLAKPNGKLAGVSGRTSNKYRGMEDIFGNVYEWLDGVLINDNIAQICRDPAKHSSSLTADYKVVGYANHNVDGYPLEMGYDSNYPEAIFPVLTGAGSTTGYCDYYYQNLGLRGVCFGGYASGGSGAGLFYWALYGTPGNASWSVGSRLLFKPPV